VHRKGDLLGVIGALQPSCRLARRLNRREQQCDQDADDRNDDQKLHERETM
jgi:hypothetical protein